MTDGLAAEGLLATGSGPEPIPPTAAVIRPALPDAGGTGPHPALDQTAPLGAGGAPAASVGGRPRHPHRCLRRTRDQRSASKGRLPSPRKFILDRVGTRPPWPTAQRLPGRPPPLAPGPPPRPPPPRGRPRPQPSARPAGPTELPPGEERCPEPSASASCLATHPPRRSRKAVRRTAPRRSPGQPIPVLSAGRVTPASTLLSRPAVSPFRCTQGGRL